MPKDKDDVWQRPTPIKPKPNFPSRYATREPFVASYENDPEINMKWLLSHEYQRIWVKENQLAHSLKQKTKESRNLARQFVNRRLVYLKKKENANSEKFKNQNSRNTSNRISTKPSHQCSKG